MAKIPRGILNETTGKVGAVIAQRWKGINYIRQYTKPRDPKSEDQLKERSDFKYIVDLGKMNYLDLLKLSFLSGTIGKNFSSWNLYISVNRLISNVQYNKHLLQISYGGLKSAPVDYFNFTKPVGNVSIGWDEEISENASADDLILIYALFKDSDNLVQLNSEGLKRSDTHITFSNQSELYWADCTILIFCQNSSGEFSRTEGKKIDIIVP